jgi:Meiotically Up-regulated Gene 113 (MUG113) protein
VSAKVVGRIGASAAVGATAADAYRAAVERNEYFKHRVPGWVYILRNPLTLLLKIGFTRISPERRRACISAQSGVEMELLYFWQGVRLHEQKLHVLFADLRRIGEWFEHDKAIERWLGTMPESGAPFDRAVCRGERTARGTVA